MYFKQIITNYENNLIFKERDLETSLPNISTIKFDLNTTYQTHLGFGGAFTESACYNLNRVNNDIKINALKAYFDSQDGINYNLGRVSIGGCDFSLSSYSYVKDYDKSLRSFNIKRDKELIIPTINLASNIHQKKVEILASPWSPPYWMKDNLSYIRGGKLNFKFANVYARYICKFIKAYLKNGVDIKMITIQNEPAANQRWDSCLYEASDEALFLNNYLKPTLKKQKLNDIEVYSLDHNRDILYSRTCEMMNESKTLDNLSGVCVHWYDNEPFEELSKVKESFPSLKIIHSEGCIESTPKYNNIINAERYARNIIGDFNNYCEAFIDWNLFLDETGGPNWVNNLCDAPIIINVNQEKIIYQLSYYYIGHFSKYIKPGSKRVKHELISSNLKVCSYITEDMKIVCVVLNESDNDEILEILEDKNFKINKNVRIPKHSICTLIMGE